MPGCESEPIPPLNFFSPQTKPELGAMHSYLIDRHPVVRPNGQGLGFTKYYDRLGNVVLRSNTAVLRLLHGVEPARLVVSKGGVELFRRNPGLMHTIALGQGNLNFVGERVEGKVYRILLKTSQGPTIFALKYTFPVEVQGGEEPDYYFSSQIDEMHLQQMAETERPADGLNMVTPLLASHVAAIRPYVNSVVTLGDLKNFVEPYPESEYALNKTNRLQENYIDFLRKHFASQPEWQEFFQCFFDEVWTALNELRTWFYRTTERPDLPLSCDRQHLKFEGSNFNTLVNINGLIYLFNQFRQDPTIFEGEDAEKARSIVRQSCHIIEVSTAIK